MQAQTQSSQAARNHIAPSGPSYRTADRLKLDLPSQPVTVNARPSQAAPSGIAHHSGLAHDAGNLLAALGLYSDLLARPGVLRPEHEHYAAELRTIAERGCRLMRNLIPHIRPDATLPHAVPARPARVRTDTSAVLREMEPLLHAIAAPQATVFIESPQTVPSVGFPAEYLERILVNLVRNAAQAIERARPGADDSLGNIRIVLSAATDHVHLTVEDDGPGMPIVAAAAFLSPSPLPPGATHGLGHRIVHELVASTGGTLTVHVRPGQGTRFHIRWPVDSLQISDTLRGNNSAFPEPLLTTGSPEVQAC